MRQYVQRPRAPRRRPGVGGEAMHLLVAEARREAAEGRGRYIPPVVAPTITHKQLQRLAVEALIANGYRCYYEPDSRLCPSGWPDVFAINPTSEPSGIAVIAVEIKVGLDKLRPAQKLWRDDFERAELQWVQLRPESWDSFLDLIDDGHVTNGRELLGGENAMAGTL